LRSRAGRGGWSARARRALRDDDAALLALCDWLRGHGVTHVAMEGTVVYWKPVYYALEGDFELLLVNAAHVKQVPGRKTDTK
jgi:transposase